MAWGIRWLNLQQPWNCDQPSILLLWRNWSWEAASEGRSPQIETQLLVPVVCQPSRFWSACYPWLVCLFHPLCFLCWWSSIVSMYWCPLFMLLVSQLDYCAFLGINQTLCCIWIQHSLEHHYRIPDFPMDPSAAWSPTMCLHMLLCSTENGLTWPPASMATTAVIPSPVVPGLLVPEVPSTELVELQPLLVLPVLATAFLCIWAAPLFSCSSRDGKSPEVYSRASCHDKDGQFPVLP